MLAQPFDAPDENSHYEYALRLRELGRTPTMDDRDPALFQRVSERMATTGVGLMLPRADGGRELGFNLELGRQPPTYYLLAAALSAAGGELGLQVRVMRLASVLLGICVVAVAWLCGRVLFPGEPFTSGATAALVALTPGFLFNSATINNDSLANLGGALAFLGVARCFRAGLDWRWVAVALAGLALGLLGKRSALTVLPAVALALYWMTAWRLPRLRWAAALVPVAALLSAPLWAFVEQERAVGWQTAQAGQVSRSREALLGDGSLLVPGGGRLLQVLSSADVARAGSEGLTIAAWVRSASDDPARVRVTLDQGMRSAGSSLTVDGTWRFARAHFRPEGSGPVRVALIAEEGGGALFDGVVVAPGDRVGVPAVNAGDVRAGTWSGAQFANMAGNGSGEFAERGPRPGLAELADALGAPQPLLAALASARPLPSGLLPQRVWFTFETYLGRFGWLTLTMPDWTYWLAAVVVVGSAGGLVLRVGRAAGLCGLFAVSAFVVGVGPFLVGALPGELPQGRYLYPAIVPLSALVAAGLAAFVPAARQEQALRALVLVGVVLNVVAVSATLLPRYTGPA